MAIYKISDLQQMLSEIRKDGYEYAEIMEADEWNDGEDTYPPSLCFEAVVDESSTIDYESVVSCDFPSNSNS